MQQLAIPLALWYSAYYTFQISCEIWYVFSCAGQDQMYLLLYAALTMPLATVHVILSKSYHIVYAVLTAVLCPLLFCTVNALIFTANGTCYAIACRVQYIPNNWFMLYNNSCCIFCAVQFLNHHLQYTLLSTPSSIWYSTAIQGSRAVQYKL